MTAPDRIPGIPTKGPGPSLLTVTSRFPTGVEWKSGVSFRQTHCFTLGTWPSCPAPGQENEDPSGGGLVSFFPFGAYVPASCDWVQKANAENEYDPEVQGQLDAASAYALSRELWTGETNTGDDTNPSLQAPLPGETDEFDETHVLATSAISPVDAIGLLLAAYAKGTHVGGAVLHIPTVLIPSLLTDDTISLSGQTYQVDGAAIVSPGPGYPDAGPTGPKTSGTPNGAVAGDDEAWIYVTGPVESEMAPMVLEPEQAEARWFDRRTNQYYVVGRRQMIYRFDTCAVWAALVTVPVAG